MKNEVFVINAIYGFTGVHNGRHFQTNSGGVNIWSITYDGTPNGLAEAFVNAQKNSFDVHEVNKILDLHGVPRNHAFWHTFTVIRTF